MSLVSSSLSFLILTYLLADISNACEFCTEPLPKEPSGEVLQLRAIACASPKPRFHMVYKQEYCTRHRLETTDFGSPFSHLWPNWIDFSLLPRRIGAIIKEETLEGFLGAWEASFWFHARNAGKRANEYHGVGSFEKVAGQCIAG